MSMLNRNAPTIERHKSNTAMDHVQPWNYASHFPSSFGAPNVLPQLPSMRRYDSMTPTNNFGTNFINSQIVTKIRIDKTSSDHSSNKNPITHLGSLPQGSSNQLIIPIDESIEKELSISSNHKSPSIFTNQSHSSNNAINPKYSMVGLVSKVRGSKKTRKKKTFNINMKDSVNSPHTVTANYLPEENVSCPQNQYTDIIDNDMGYQSVSDPVEVCTIDIGPFERTITNRTIESGSSLRHPSLTKIDSMSTMKRNTNELSVEDPILIIALFSEPLVYIKNTGRDQREPEEYRPVDFEGELTDISEVVENNANGNISFKIGSLNIDNFRKTIENCPEIIHIMCHGDFDKKSNRYYLDFENENAEVFPFYKENIDQYFENKGLADTALIFLNACYSEQVAQCFLDRKVKCVIAIDKNSKIDDRVSRDFAKTFYRHLFFNMTFERAFKNTVSDLKMTYSHNQGSYFSFCSHLHKEGCRWNDSEHLELLHVILKCDCPNKFINRHRASCLAVFNFQMEFWTDTVSESLALEEEVLLCCCSPEIPHEEVLKFKIFYQKDHYKNMKLYELINQTSYRSKTENYKDFDDMKIEKKFANVSSIGFNFYMYQLFNYFVKESGRIGVVHGDYGSGKTTLVQHFANYCKHRNKFNYIHFKDYSDIHAITDLISEILNSIKRPDKSDNNRKGFGQTRRNTKTLFILDNFDVILEKNTDRVKREIHNFIQNQDLYFLITLSKSKVLNFPLENKEVTIKPLSYYVGAQLFLNKSRPMLPSEYKNLNSLIYYPDFERVQTLMVFFPFNLISLATKIGTVQFNLDGMRNLIDKINKRNQIERIIEIGMEDSVQIEDDIEEYKFLIFLGFLEQGAYFIEDIGSYSFENSKIETQAVIRFILNEVIKSDQLSPNQAKECNRISQLKFTEVNQSSEIFVSIFKSLQDIIMDTRLKDVNRIEVRTMSLEAVPVKDNDRLLIIKTLNIRTFLKKKFDRKAFKSFISVINFLSLKVNCLFSYFQEHHLIVEDTYFTAFRELEFVGFLSHQKIENGMSRKRTLMSFIKIHLLNMKSILDDDILLSCFFNQIKKDEKFRDNSLWAFEQMIMKFFSIAEMESLNETYFDIEIDFKRLVRIIEMDKSLSDSLTRLYLQLSLFSLNSMLKRAFLEKYSYDYNSRMNNRIALIKSIFREPYVKNNEENFFIYKLEFYFLRIRANNKLVKGIKHTQNERNAKMDKKSLHLLAKLEILIKSLDPTYHSHFLSKVYLMIAKQKYKSNNLDLKVVANLEYCYLRLQEGFNLNLSLRVHLFLCIIHHDWNNKVLREYHQAIATEINEKVKSTIYEVRLNRMISALHTDNVPPKSQIAFLVSSYFQKSNVDFSQIEIVDLEKFKEPFLAMMEDNSECHANFMFEPLNLSSMVYMLNVKMHFKVFCLYFNNMTRNCFFFDVETESVESKAISYDQLYEIIKNRKASIETLIILNPISDSNFLNKICLDVPYTIYIEKYELANLTTPEAEKQITNFVILNLMKQFISRIVYEKQYSIIEVFNNSVDIVYDCLEAFIARNLTHNEERPDIELQSENEPKETIEESMAKLIKGRFRFKLIWNNETPFFEKLIEIIGETPCIINIDSADDFGTRFRMHDQVNYSLVEDAPIQRRLYKSCQNYTSSEQITDWLFETLKQYNSYRKRGRRENGNGKKTRENAHVLETVFLYDLPFIIDPFISDNLARLIILLKVTVIIFNTMELDCKSRYILHKKQISLPKQDFNLMLFEHVYKENTKTAESIMRELTKVITYSVFLPSGDDEQDQEADQSEVNTRHLTLDMRIDEEMPEDD